jgi:DNA-binding HxlR family transcriptional regulator
MSNMGENQIATENKIEKKTHGPQECPITATINVIGGKWKPPIIWILLRGPVRFGELGKMMPDIALKVLSRQLKELEAEGIIIRRAYPEVPPRVEYSLSGKGESLRDIMERMSEWSKNNILSEYIG